MNLLQLRTEALAHGFDPIQYGARITNWINDAQSLIARRVDYYVDETVQAFSTVAGTSSYTLPANFARMRSLFDTTRHIEMEYVSIRDIDRSSVFNGAPAYYALYGPNMQLYPVPDGVYQLEWRYWSMPATLVNDTDVPTMPADWHSLLWTFAVGQAYEADDDPQMGGYWAAKFDKDLSMFAADVKFPTTDGPTQAPGMWSQKRTLGSNNAWGFYYN